MAKVSALERQQKQTFQTQFWAQSKTKLLQYTDFMLLFTRSIRT